MFVFSDIGLLVLSVIGVSSWLFTFRTRGHRYWRGSVYSEQYKSRESHVQEGRVPESWATQWEISVKLSL